MLKTIFIEINRSETTRIKQSSQQIDFKAYTLMDRFRRQNVIRLTLFWLSFGQACTVNGQLLIVEIVKNQKLSNTCKKKKSIDIIKRTNSKDERSDNNLD